MSQLIAIMLQPFTIRVYPHALLLLKGHHQSLTIPFDSPPTRVLPSEEMISEERAQLVYGIVYYDGVRYLVFLTQSSSIQGREKLYKVEGMRALALERGKQKECLKFQQGLKEVVSHNFLVNLELQQEKSIFFWNQEALKSFGSFMGTSSHFFGCFAQGWMHNVLMSEQFDIWFLFRRAKYMSGCRFLYRGADIFGNAANFVQCKAIMRYESKQYSYVTLRGSVPLNWQQQSNLLNRCITLKGGEQSQVQTMRHHLNIIREWNSKQVIFLDLLSRTSGQKILSQTFQSVLRLQGQSGLSYVNLDYHHVKKTAVSLADQLNQFIIKISKDQFSCQGPDSSQELLIRVNCLDCLDRTNVLTSLLLERAVLNFLYKKRNNQKGHQMMGIMKLLRSHLQQLGNKISLVYAGSQSVYSSSRLEEVGFFGQIGPGLQRLYSQCFKDEHKSSILTCLAGEQIQCQILQI